MRISVHPARMLEGEIKLLLLNSLLKFLFIVGIAFLVYVITSKTYVPPAGMNHNYERVIQAFESTPPAPY